jgi:exportin-5
MKMQDPEISKKIIQLVSTFSIKALSDRPEFAMTLLDYIFHTKLPEDASASQYSEAVKDLERVCNLEMQKLAMMFADDFMVGTHDVLFRSSF